ncbi:MAG TPA: porin family protein [Cyclobacteriaceae bacterium]|nr:porin family protein [Cyclobacteriaceae bacterium]
MKNQILRISLLSVFGLALSVAVVAQESDRTWSIGPEVGASFSKHGMDADDSDYKAGLAAGGFVTYSIRNTYGFTAKVLFNQKGGQSDGGELKEQLNYIEIPVLARLFFNREGTVRPNVFFGPSFGFLTGAKWKVGDGDYENVEDIEGDLFDEVDSYKDMYNTFDFGLGAGLGVNIKVGDEMYFVIDARYTYGFSDIYRRASGTVNNQNVAVTAGLSFGIGN